MTTNHRTDNGTATDATVVLGRVPDAPTPAEDDLATELAAAAPRRLWNRGTLVLAGLLLVGGGFLGGAYVQQQYGQSATGQQSSRSAAGGTRSGQFPGFGANAGTGRQGGTTPGASATPAASSGPSTTTGTVKLVDGTTVYIETADGQVITVRTTGSTAVRTTTKASLTDLKAGDTVTAQGGNATDGTLTATSLTTE